MNNPMNQPEDSFDRQRRLAEISIKEFGKKNVESYERAFLTGKADSSYNCSVFNYFGVNVFFYAAMTGNLFWVKELVKQGASVYTKHQYGKTALHFAAEYNDWKALTWLVEQGLSVNSKDDWDYTVLYYAAKSGNLEMVQWLVEQALTSTQKAMMGLPPCKLPKNAKIRSWLSSSKITAHKTMTKNIR